MATTQISKQDYLRKYLSGGNDKKKRKKRKISQGPIIKSKIIDDDIDIKDIKANDSDGVEVYDVAEEAPQIVGILDERPEEVRLMSEYKNTKKWRVITDGNGFEEIKVTAICNSEKDNESKEENDENTWEKQDSSSARTPVKETETTLIEKKLDSDSWAKDEDSDPPLLRHIKKEKSDSDVSPPRKLSKQRDSDSSSRRKCKKSHESSPRKIKKEKSDSDVSPPRCRKREVVHKKSKRDKSDSDPSLRRKSNVRYDSDLSPPRKSKKTYDSDESLPRRSKKSSASRSDKRKHHHRHHSCPSLHKCSRKHKDRSSSHHKRDVKKRKSRSPEVRPNHRESGKNKNSEHAPKSKFRDRSHSRGDTSLKNTSSGKKSGLQNAEDLRKEIQEMKDKEKEVEASVSGKNEGVVHRDKKTGRRIDPKEESRKRREKEAKEAEKMAQYAVWGKGVKQVQDSQNKKKDDEYEMSKPLARYADDKDLDEMLRNKEWDGDPMLDYMRKKRKKESSKKTPEKPQYEGPYMPNRYGIKPGHLWDGVDRSNGFEKRWFEEQNAKKAREEEAFKWSTSDM